MISMFPIIKNVKKIAEVLNRQQKMYSGRMVETSGGLFIALLSQHAENFCRDFEAIAESGCWIIGHVESGSGKVKIAGDVNITEV